MEFNKEFYGLLSAVLTLVGYFPYLQNIIKGKTRPHIFSWVIWTMLSGIVFFAQLAKGAGPGAWNTGIACAICIAIVALTIWQGDRSITRSDWISFLLGLTGIPIWRLTNDPTGAVIMATLVYAAAYYPTFRKSFQKPQEETLFAYGVSILRSILSLVAMQVSTVATLLFPLAVSVMNIAFISMVLFRRKAQTVLENRPI